MTFNTGLPPSRETFGSNNKGTDGTNTSVEAVTEVTTGNRRTIRARVFERRRMTSAYSPQPLQ